MGSAGLPQAAGLLVWQPGWRRRLTALREGGAHPHATGRGRWMGVATGAPITRRTLVRPALRILLCRMASPPACQQAGRARYRGGGAPRGRLRRTIWSRGGACVGLPSDFRMWVRRLHLLATQFDVLRVLSKSSTSFRIRSTGRLLLRNRGGGDPKGATLLGNRHYRTTRPRGATARALTQHDSCTVAGRARTAP